MAQLDYDAMSEEYAGSVCSTQDECNMEEVIDDDEEDDDMSKYTTKNVEQQEDTAVEEPKMTKDNMHLFDNQGNYVGPDTNEYETCSDDC